MQNAAAQHTASDFDGFNMERRQALPAVTAAQIAGELHDELPPALTPAVAAYVDERINLALRERDELRAKLAEANKTIEVLETAAIQAARAQLGHTDRGTTISLRRQLHAIAGTDDDVRQELQDTVDELVLDTTVGDYTKCDLMVLEAFAIGCKYAHDCRPTGRSVRLFRTAVSNARQELANAEVGK